MIHLTLHVNGEDRGVDAPPLCTLIEALRDVLGLQSVREGCGIGVCGACTVLLDGHPISSCLTLAAMAEGHDILTLEGLPTLPPLHPIQEAFIKHAGFQCSYCTPGILLTVKALLDDRPNATDDEVREYLAGNLCRCGSYVKIMDAVREALTAQRR
ncbi:MAG: Isoquinoline 1-oxidoreductase alpha subunit protein [Chloroflexi bacterium]|nr:Isoquinoline 1-oxidoreductase alpha subunit protein [Chloroflexota bacterium]